MKGSSATSLRFSPKTMRATAPFGQCTRRESAMLALPRRNPISTAFEVALSKHGSILQDNDDQVGFIRGSGNVFADLGLQNPEERLAKARLMHIINCEIKHRGLTQIRATETMGLDQADISRIAHGRGSKFSTDHLIGAIRRLGMDVDLTISVRFERIVMAQITARHIRAPDNRLDACSPCAREAERRRQYNRER